MALSLIAVIVGIFYTIRKLDARSRSEAEFPAVPAELFRAWQEREVRVYGRAAFACVLKLVLGIVAEYWLAPIWPGNESRLIGFAIDLGWFIVVLWTFFLGRQLSKERRRLGIVLNALIVSDRARTEEEPTRDDP